MFVCVFSCFCVAKKMKMWGGKNAITAKGDRLTIYNNGDKIVLNGNATIKRSDMNIKANKTTIWQKRRKFSGYGKVFTERFFDNGDFVKAISDACFYDDKNKIMKLSNIDDLDYYSVLDDNTLNILAEDLKVTENNGIRTAEFDNVYSMSLPFVETKDDGTVLSGTSTIKADKVKATAVIGEENGRYAEFFGNVIVERNYSNGDNFKAVSDILVYSKKDGYVEFTGIEQIQAFVLEENTTYYLECDLLRWDMNTDMIYCKGEPLIFKDLGGSYVVEAFEAVYDQAKKEIMFSKDPVATQSDDQGDGIYKAENILYYLKTKITKMIGAVDVDFLPKEKVDTNN